MRKTVIIAAAAALLLAACSKKETEAPVEAGMPEFVPTADDTLQVTALVTDFMTRLRADDTEGAVKLLRNSESVNPYTFEPDSLEDDERAEVIRALNMLDVQDYSYDGVDFGKYTNLTTVTCNVHSGAGFDTKLVLKPVKAGFTWRLALQPN